MERRHDRVKDRGLPSDTTATLRNAARDLMRTVRELGRQVGQPGVAPSNVMAARIADRARTEAAHWPTREARRRFLAEFASEVRNEPRDDSGAYGRFLEQVATMIEERQADEA